MKIILVTNETEIRKCWPAIQLLRPHLVEEDFAPMVLQMMAEGYQLAYMEGDGIAVSVIGYRFQQFLYNGRHCYIDDLVTLPAEQGKGYAGKLIDYVTLLSKEKGYPAITLDSGFTRVAAHRLYLQKHFEISAFHFSKMI